jgi:pantothenate kinase
VDVPSDIAKQRLVTRHLRAGIETTEEAAVARVEENDLQNAEMIKSKLIQPDIVIVN